MTEAPALLHFSFVNMSTGADQAPRRGKYQHHAKISSARQFGSWSFNTPRTGPVTVADAKDKRRICSNLTLANSSFASLSLSQRETPVSVDIEMSDVPDNDDSLVRTMLTDRPSLIQAQSSQDNYSTYVFDDSDIIEVTEPEFKKSVTQTKILSSSQTQRLLKADHGLSIHTGTVKSVPKTPVTLRNQLPSFQNASRDRKRLQSQNPSNPFNRESRIQAVDAAIERIFPVHHRPIIDRQLRTSIQLNIEDDDKASEEVSEDAIENNLQSLVTSLPQWSIARPQPKLSQQLPKRRLNAVEHKDLHLQQGTTVELYNGSFLRLDSILRNGCGTITIKGSRLIRDRDYGRKLPDGRLNELVWINEVDEDENQVGLESVLQEEAISNVKGVRQVIFTNSPWSELSYQHQLLEQGLSRDAVDVEHVEENEQLYCRWKSILVHSKAKSDAEACICALSEAEAEGIGKLDARDVRNNWQKEKNATGRVNHRATPYNVLRETTERAPQYTLGDCFCGAGGISRGAVQAGLRLAWGFDSDENAIQTHRHNFERYSTQSLSMDDEEFLESIKKKRYYADVVHYSPPCQPFSPANHNKNEERDFINQKALFSLHHLTERLKPRIVTIEETAGLMNRHTEWFDALISMFTSVGYSIRWKIVRCQRYGIPQSRVRLLLIAAA